MNRPHYVAIEQFREAMRVRGLVPPEDLLADGRLHRCHVEGRGGENDGAYLLHLDDFPAGGFENHKDGQGWENWHFGLGLELSPSERDANRASMERARKERDATEKLRWTQAKEAAMQIWASGRPCSTHAYLDRKGIKPYSARVICEGPHQGELVIRLVDTEGEIHSLQFIDAQGKKRFLPGGRKRGCYFPMGSPTGMIYIAEGFATAASIHEATGIATAVAFDAGNMRPVAEAIRAKFPSVQLVICADDDWQTDGNPGMAKALEAAQASGGAVVVPHFGEMRSPKDTDFNDLHKAHGVAAVRACIDSQFKMMVDGMAEQTNFCIVDSLPEWPEPIPLTAKTEALPYPIASLPPTIRAAVEEVHGFVKAPLPLVASSAVAALSLAVQALWDIKRAERLVGPSGVFLLSIADSGERKSTCDGFFTQAIKDYQTQQAEATKSVMTDYAANLTAWEAVQVGIKTAISAAVKAGKDTQGPERDMRAHEHRKPVRPRVPRLIYADATPEALKWCLAKDWPSAGVISSEAGVVFGAHGMGKDSVMRNLATLNQLWDGADIATERRSTDSFTVRGARLTMALQVQEPTLRAFFAQSGALARGSGFLARFLVAWPESTQGSRFFSEAPINWPHLAEFNQRIGSILASPVPIDDAGALTPTQLTLSVEAKQAWVAFHDRIEGQLHATGRLHEIRDVASKIADNAVRVAALFHVFENPGSGVVPKDIFHSASQVVEWHLAEAQRFFGELAVPQDVADTVRLETWLVKWCREHGSTEVPIADVQQNCPSGLRNKAAIDAAVQMLQEHGRARMLKRGKRKIISLNPALLANAKVANPANGDSRKLDDHCKISKISVSDTHSDESMLPLASGDL